jgi:hypothetical protein
LLPDHFTLCRLGNAEEQLRQKQLKTFFGMLLEASKEGVIEALMDNTNTTDVSCL